MHNNYNRSNNSNNSNSILCLVRLEQYTPMAFSH